MINSQINIVSKQVNKERKTFYASINSNKLYDGQTTRALGSDEESAEKVVGYMNEIFKRDGYETLSGFKNLLENEQLEDKNYIKAIKLIYDKTDFWEIVFSEKDQEFFDDNIKLSESDNKKMILFIGEPGVGKTEIISKIIGSSKYNTPAVTQSNTTVSQFVADIDEKAEKLQGVVQFKSAIEIENLAMNLVIKLMEYISINVSGNKKFVEIDKTDLKRELLSSYDAKFQMKYLFKNNTNIISASIDNIGKEYAQIWMDDIMPLYKDEMIEDKKMFEIIMDKIGLSEVKPNKEYRDIYSKLNKKSLEKIENLMKKMNRELVTQILNVKVKSLKKVFNFEKEYLDSYKIEYKYYNDLLNEKAYGIEFEELKDSNISDIRTLYYSIEKKDKSSSKLEIYSIFFNILRIMSSYDKDTSSLHPIINNIKIKGNFINDVNGECNNLVIFDSEGIGHDANNMETSPKTIENLRKVDKIFLVFDITRSINPVTKIIVDTISRNGGLPKLKFLFNKVDLLSNTEDVEDRKQTLFDGIFHLFSKDENSLIYSFKNRFKEESIALGYNNIEIDHVDQMNKMNDKYFISSEEIKENFNTIITQFVNEEEIKKITNIKYNLVKFIVDVWESFVKIDEIYRNSILNSHWKIVQAYNSRVTYNFDSRQYRYIYPEADIKDALKHELQKLLNQSVQDSHIEVTEQIATELQNIQKEISVKIDEIVFQKFYLDNKEKFLETLNLSGVGSGNLRKKQIYDVISKLLSTDKSNSLLYALLEEISSHIQIQESIGSID